MTKIAIIGGVAGGASAAARLRRLDEHAEIILFEKGEYISFANCGLPYYIGGEITDKSALTLQTPESFHARFRIDVRVQNEVLSIDPEKKELHVINHKLNQTYVETYDKLVLSPGAKPIKPNIEGINSPNIFTLRTIPDTYRIKAFVEEQHPKRVAVVGGGYIGVEMVENLHQAGLEVTLVEMQNQVIAPLDYDMACDVHHHMESKGVHLLLNHAVQSIQEHPDGLHVQLDKGELVVDMLILAIGVQPESDLAKQAGLKVTQRGAIIVNDAMQTSDPSIYAVGDAIEVTDYVSHQQSVIPLAGPANKQGRIAADQICDEASTYTGTQGSAILKVFDLTVATTGINEKTAQRLGLSYEKSYTYSASHASYYPGAVNMSIKVLFEKETGVILGAQLVGYDGVDKRCDVLATAIRFHATAKDLTQLELCYAPPYSSAKDPVNMAGYVIENIVSGKVKIIHWHDIAQLPTDGSVTLLDTRTTLEYENGHIPHFINIPLDELRDRLSELDPSKQIYVTCQIGLRGYLACRILSAHGFDCYNLSGGYRLYQSVMKEAKQQTPPLPKNPQPTMQEDTSKTISLNACGLQCPGPIVKLASAISDATIGDVIEISTTDPAFASDIEGYCRRTGNQFEGMRSENGVSYAKIRKALPIDASCSQEEHNGKNFIVFSGDLDKAIASFIMANAAAALGRKTSMFFTFWGLNVLRKPEKVQVDKNLISRMFGMMMPRGSKKLSLSRMNMGGLGAKMIRGVMKDKHVSSLEDLIQMAQQNGVELIACSMSMDVMGIKPEELIGGVTLGGAAAMLAHAEESDMSLFI